MVIEISHFHWCATGILLWEKSRQDVLGNTVAIIDKTPKSRDDKGIDFVEYVNEILRNEKERNKIGQSVYKNGLSGMKMFGEFLLTEKLGTYAPDKIYVSEISISIVEKYINWRIIHNAPRSVFK